MTESITPTPTADTSTPWIVEGLLTTLSAEGGVNIAPMGPRVNADFSLFIFRPFKTSQSYKNLKATGQGVFHVTDDALLIAHGAMGLLDGASDLLTRPATKVKGVVLTAACRYHELAVERVEDEDERTTIIARTRLSQTLRDFFGFNRARHAVIEAAILATRVHLTGVPFVLQEYDRLMVMVDKTGGPNEHQAMTELTRYVQQAPRP